MYTQASYANYVKACKAVGQEPLSFSSWVQANMEWDYAYDVAWAEADVEMVAELEELKTGRTRVGA